MSLLLRRWGWLIIGQWKEPSSLGKSDNSDYFEEEWPPPFSEKITIARSFWLNDNKEMNKEWLITVLLHGSRQGSLKLYNLKTEKQIYRFKGWDGGSAVTCLTPCPSVLDAVAVGLASGTIVVHNLKFDEEFVRFRQVRSLYVTQDALYSLSKTELAKVRRRRNL